MIQFPVNSDIATTGHKFTRPNKITYDNQDIELQMSKLVICCSIKVKDIEQIVIEK